MAITASCWGLLRNALPPTWDSTSLSAILRVKTQATRQAVRPETGHMDPVVEALPGQSPMQAWSSPSQFCPLPVCPLPQILPVTSAPGVLAVLLCGTEVSRWIVPAQHQHSLFPQCCKILCDTFATLLASSRSIQLVMRAFWLGPKSGLPCGYLPLGEKLLWSQCEIYTYNKRQLCVGGEDLIQIGTVMEQKFWIDSSEKSSTWIPITWWPSPTHSSLSTYTKFVFALSLMQLKEWHSVLIALCNTKVSITAFTSILLARSPTVSGTVTLYVIYWGTHKWLSCVICSFFFKKRMQPFQFWGLMSS